MEKSKLIKRIVMISLAGLVVANCSPKGEAPSQFRARIESGDTITTQAEIIANIYNRGVKTDGNDKDINGDSINDWYVVCNDGKAYFTSPRKIINSDDSIKERTWYQTTEETIKNSKKGKSDAF